MLSLSQKKQKQHEKQDNLTRADKALSKSMSAFDRDKVYTKKTSTTPRFSSPPHLRWMVQHAKQANEHGENHHMGQIEPKDSNDV